VRGQLLRMVICCLTTLTQQRSTQTVYLKRLTADAAQRGTDLTPCSAEGCRVVCFSRRLSKVFCDAVLQDRWRSVATVMCVIQAQIQLGVFDNFDKHS